MLTAAGCLIAVDEAVAASDAVLIQDQIAVFKALGRRLAQQRACLTVEPLGHVDLGEITAR
jgi:hypothetical protein